MFREILIGRDADGAETRYRLEVFEEAGRWTSVLARLDESGEPESAAVTPRFYGLTREQARRRMLTVLENQHEEVVIAPSGTGNLNSH